MIIGAMSDAIAFAAVVGFATPHSTHASSLMFFVFRHVAAALFEVFKSFKIENSQRRMARRRPFIFSKNQI
jgi:hypothetical protein